jgi:hypothetical protein
VPITEEKVITQTRLWLEKIVIGCNFCPFAAKPFFQDKIRYRVVPSAQKKDILETLVRECSWLEENAETETSLLILPEGYEKFNAYLDLLDLAEQLLEKEGYEGIFQLASFHPDYRFAGTKADDAANYTNRSPYPILHLLKEESIEKALEKFPDPDKIPDKNIAFAREKGLEYMKNLLKSCL